jgi:uncharacterized protein (DUF1330 family)
MAICHAAGNGGYIGSHCPKSCARHISIPTPNPIKKYGARFLVRAGRFENPEGSSRSRNVVIEFPSYQAALDCWKSPEYQEAIKLRQPVSSGDFVIIEGYEGPQPS